MLILLTQWALKVGLDPASARQKAKRGKLPAVKIGRQWFIEENTPNIDNRIKTGEYRGWRKKTSKK